MDKGDLWVAALMAVWVGGWLVFRSRRRRTQDFKIMREARAGLDRRALRIER